MIRLGQRIKSLLLHPQEKDEAKWRAELEVYGCSHLPLLVETISGGNVLRCPSCYGPAPFEEPAGGAGLVVCAGCARPFVALRFLGGENGVEWASFPWPP